MNDRPMAPTGDWDSLSALEKAVRSAWNYFQSPNSYSEDERKFVFELLDEAHGTIGTKPANEPAAAPFRSETSRDTVRYGSEFPGEPQTWGDLFRIDPDAVPAAGDDEDEVAVKSLEWEEVPKHAPLDGPEVVRVIQGNGIVRGFATVAECTDGRFTLLSDPTCERFGSLEEAQAAAQGDYDRKVRSALD